MGCACLEVVPPDKLNQGAQPPGTPTLQHYYHLKMSIPVRLQVCITD